MRDLTTNEEYQDLANFVIDYIYTNQKVLDKFTQLVHENIESRLTERFKTEGLNIE